MATSTLTDWRSIEDDREKYQAYLCSNEWAKLKTAVHERAGGNCERCGQFPISAVHHLSYARKYAEMLEDLAGWCKHCHNFTHDKHWFDPKKWSDFVKCLCVCKNLDMPFSPEASFHIAAYWGFDERIRILLSGVSQLEMLRQLYKRDDDPLSTAISELEEELPFVFTPHIRYCRGTLHYDRFWWVAKLFGFQHSPPEMEQWWTDGEKDEEK